MPQNKHPKRVLANKMRSSQEKGFGISVFQTFAWEKKKKGVEQRVARKKRESMARAIVRKAALHPEKWETSEKKNELRIATGIVKDLEKKKANKKPFISKRSQRVWAPGKKK